MPRRRWGMGWGYRKFQNAGYRFTLPRQTILNVLEKSDTHLSVENILEEVQKECKECDGVNLTTIYRNLEVLIELGIVSKYDFGDGRARYELTQHINKKHNHKHLVCTVCGRIIDCRDFLEEERKKESEQIKKKYSFNIQEEIHQFRGICSNCRKK
ncbi:Fur family transcriptional regulator [Elusimicrobiota bacterium]